MQSMGTLKECSMMYSTSILPAHPGFALLISNTPRHIIYLSLNNLRRRPLHMMSPSIVGSTPHIRVHVDPYRVISAS